MDMKTFTDLKTVRGKQQSKLQRLLLLYYWCPVSPGHGLPKRHGISAVMHCCLAPRRHAQLSEMLRDTSAESRRVVLAHQQGFIHGTKSSQCSVMMIKKLALKAIVFRTTMEMLDRMSGIEHDLTNMLRRMIILSIYLLA